MAELKYKVGDTVRVKERRSFYHGATGSVADVDRAVDKPGPYVVEFPGGLHLRFSARELEEGTK